MLKETASPPTLEEDLAYGQGVIVTARWILVAAGLFLVLWNPDALGLLRIQVTIILLLAFWNFYLHAQLLRRRPPNKRIVYAASLGDLVVITLIVITGGGLEAGAFVFYFPAILAYSVAFPLVGTMLLTSGVIWVYFIIGLFSLGQNAHTPEAATFMVLLTRIVIIAAVAVCGGLYRRIEHERRLRSVESEQQLLDKIRPQSTSPQPG